MTKYALLIIDMQKAYFRNQALAEARPNLVAKINQLAETAASRSVPTYVIKTEHKPDRSTWSLNMHDDDEGYLFEDTEDVELVDGLAVSHPPTIIKTRDSAFFQTELATKLREAGIDTVLVCGVSTHGCIFQTAADAYAEDFRVILVEDAIASHDPKFHDSTLALLKQEYRQELVDSSRLISRLRLHT